MKYSNKINTPRRFSLLVFFAVFGILTGLLIAILIAFPIQLSSSDMRTNDAWYAKFFVFWPESSVKQELIERKKIKRYAKLEMQRRFEKQLKMMNFLNTPLYDLWLDKNIEIITNNTMGVPNGSSFFWPTLPNTFRTSEVSPRNSQFVISPDDGKIGVRKGLYLGSGELIKSNMPAFNSKRYLVLEVLPLATGRIKITLGQFVWTKIFSENEIHKTVKFFIKINDSLAQNYKLSNISSSFYVLDLKVVTVTPNGRESIYIAKESRIWDGNQQTASQSENPDPLTEVVNSYQFFERDTTLAKGYNTVFISVDSLDTDPMENQNIFSKLMLNLKKFSADSFVIKNTLDASKYNEDKFKIPVIYKKYGYKTVLFSHADTALLGDEITSLKGFETISKSWLADSDTRLQQQINAQAQNKPELEGLNAIFKPQATEVVQSIDHKEFQSMAAYLKQLARFADQKNNLVFDDHFLIARKNYIPTLVDAFQKWSTSQTQNRLLIDLTLAAHLDSVQTTLQDLAFVLMKSPTLKLREYMRMHTLDREFKQIIEVLQSRHITHRTIVIVLLKNQKNPAKSSAIMFIPGLKPKMPSSSIRMSMRDLMSYSMSIVGIPTETAINFAHQYTNPETGQKVTLNYLQELFGIQYTKFNLVLYPNKNNCNPLTWQATNASIFDIKSNFPFYQVSHSGALEFFPCAFGENALEIEWKQASFPIQPIATQQTKASRAHSNHVYGYFLPTFKDMKPIGLFYGRKFVDYMNFPFNFQHTEEQMSTLFLVDQKEVDQLRSLAIKSFQTTRLDPRLTQNTQAALFISKVYSE